MGKTALILGAGVGGIVAAETLRKLLPAEHRVIVVEREPNHVFAPSLLWHIVGANKRADFTRPISALAAKGIELVTGEIEHIDPEALSVKAAGQVLRGDSLVIALGADYAPEAVPGLAKYGINLYTLAGAETIRAALESFRGNRIVVLTAAPATSARPRPTRRPCWSMPGVRSGAPETLSRSPSTLPSRSRCRSLALRLAAN